MTAAAHPAWCSLARCEVGFGGAHSSEPTALDFDRHSSAAVRCRLWLRPTVGLYDKHGPVVYVELVAGDTGNGKRVRIDMTVRQAGQLRDQLAELVGAAS